MSEPVIAHPEDRAPQGWGALAGERGDLTWRTLIDSRVGPTDSLSIGVARARPGQALRAHTHPQPEVYLVLAGVATVMIDGNEHELPTGGCVFIPGGVPHGCRNAGSDDVEFAYVFPVDSAAEVEYDFGVR